MMLQIYGIDCYTVPGAAEALGVCEGTIWSWLSRGPLERVQTPIGRTMISAESVDMLVAERAAHPPRLGRPRKAAAGGAP